MSNLLDKSSIVLTASAYDNGKVLCVKPSDGSGDFDFSRNSAATRVNAQGLVEDVQILSSNLVQNGSFSQLGSELINNGNFSQQGSELVTGGDFSNPSDWIKSSQVTISNGKARILSTDGSFQSIKQNGFIASQGKTIKFTIEITDIQSGQLKVSFAGGATNTNIPNSVGTHTLYVLNDGTIGQLSIGRVAGVTDVTIDNVSLVEVGQDWTLGTGWSIGENKAVSDGAIGSNNLFQSGAVVVGKQYKIDITILDYVSGQVQVSAGAVPRNTMLNNGNFTFYQTASSTTNFFIIAQSFIGSVTNISVKEVGQNWDLTGTWIIGDNVANCDGSQSGNADLIQALPTGAGKQYKITYTISNYLAGDIKVRFSSGNTTSAQSSNGTFTEIITAAANGGFRLRGNDTFNGSVTNISVIEITDDTNLPRINYEGFSYQDALGSELVTNGDFATDSNWNKTNAVIENGKATINVINGAYSNIAQIGVFASGKTYVLKATIQGNTGSNNKEIKIQDNGANSGGLTTANGTIVLNESVQSIELKWVSNASSNNLVISRNSGTGNYSFSIDNVSVKEVTGQEVVPDSGCGSWLWENQSTNLITQSELFSDSSWVKSNTTIVSNVLTSPDGAINADNLKDTANNSIHRLRDGVALLANTDYTISVFAKKGTLSNLQVALLNTADSKIASRVFNLENGTLGEELTATGGTLQNSEIKDYGNGWYRCSITAQLTTTPNQAQLTLAPLSSGNTQTAKQVTYLGNGTGTVSIWGAQLEEQTYGTSYIPTDGTSVTRNKDVCTNGGSAASINSTEGVLYAEIKTLTELGLFRQINLNDGTTANRIYISKRANNGNLEFRMDNSLGSLNFSISKNTTNNYVKVAFRYGLNNFAVFIDGVNQNVNPTGNTFSANTFNNLEFTSPINQNFFGKTKCLAVWKEALTDTELQELTTI